MLELSLCRLVFVLTCPIFFLFSCLVLSCILLPYLALPYLIFILSCFALPFLFVSCPILSSGRLLFCDFLVLSCYLFRVLFFSYDCLVLFLSCISMVLPCLILGLCWHCLILCLAIFLSSSVHNQTGFFKSISCKTIFIPRLQSKITISCLVIALSKTNR